MFAIAANSWSGSLLPLISFSLDPICGFSFRLSLSSFLEQMRSLCRWFSAQMIQLPRRVNWWAMVIFVFFCLESCRNSYADAHHHCWCAIFEIFGSRIRIQNSLLGARRCDQEYVVHSTGRVPGTTEHYAAPLWCSGRSILLSFLARVATDFWPRRPKTTNWMTCVLGDFCSPKGQLGSL